jgi:hypothetical protein
MEQSITQSNLCSNIPCCAPKVDTHNLSINVTSLDDDHSTHRVVPNNN